MGLMANSSAIYAGYQRPCATSYPDPPSKKNCCARWCTPGDTCILIAMLVVLLTLLAYLAIVPAASEGTPELTVTSASVTDFNISGFPPILSANFAVTLSINNPSAMVDHVYDNVVASMVYGNTAVAEATLPSFYIVKRGGSATLRVMPTAAWEQLEPDVASGISTDFAASGAIIFSFNMTAQVYRRPWVLCPGTGTFTAQCKGVTIWFANRTATIGSTIGSPKMCQADLAP